MLTMFRAWMNKSRILSKKSSRPQTNGWIKKRYFPFLTNNFSFASTVNLMQTQSYSSTSRKLILCLLELLTFYRFCGMVNLKSICIIGGPEGTSPSKVKMYELFRSFILTISRFANRDNLDFDSAANTRPNQEILLPVDLNGEIDHALQYELFSTSCPDFS